MGKHRNAHSLLQEAMNRVAALKAKVAQDIITDDPAIQALDNKIAEVKKGMLKVNRWLDPNLGLANSIEKWTERISIAQENLANAQKSKAEMMASLGTLKAERQKLAESLAADADIEAECIVGDIQ